MECPGFSKVWHQPGKTPGRVIGVAAPVIVVALAAAVEEHVVELTTTSNDTASENLCHVVFTAGVGEVMSGS